MPHEPGGVKAGDCPSAREHERGMAVVSALLIVAVIAVLAASLLGRQSAFIRTTQGEQFRAQARWLLRGEVSQAQRTLRAEAVREPTTRLDGLWNQSFSRQGSGQVAADGGRLVSEITDEQGKFNLRNLVDRGRIDPEEAEVFTRLCALVGVPAPQAQSIMRRVVVSLGDADVQSSGTVPDAVRAQAAKLAESLGLPAELPRTAQAPRLRALEDLLAVPGVDASVLARLTPFVTVLPERTWINSNTASPEVVASGVPGLSLERARALLAARDKGQWFINRGDFTQRLRMPEQDLAELRIGITSNWFRVASVLDTVRTKFVLTVLLHDDKRSLPRVVWLREGV
ncbi:type II secretion system minor pseudopilin GspK [Variovorax sp. PAMC26660]|uniref:type II secretion system minor pseudopilin GspK n=1 Tax=Variovorax sp. PAMC26660 TaxID=2762322 RepID=UPI00164E2BB7|nr:type II secretion system minor pseudopilin GspK [Variovorax sp. PAMC26660]QNK66994.1 type II secretion system minor pseudopilin GspK [Variovorax sp. PAMC26660]